MQQLSLSETVFPLKKGKKTRKVEFLAELECVVPWSRFKGLGID